VPTSWFSQWCVRARVWWGQPQPLSGAMPAPDAHVRPELRQAHALLAAVDAGGIPLHPGKVNAIARGLGLEVSTKAPVEDTIARIRLAIARSP
jgi:hypothetical protein